jgi:ABC-2 type transport system permease protein
MFNLLKIEWLKLKNYAAFKVLSIFYIAGIFLSNYVVYIFNKNVVGGTQAGDMLNFSPYNFDMTWQTTSYTVGCLLLLPAMIIIMIISNEYTFKTNRQNIIDGWSRHEFIIVKIVMAFIIALVSTILVFITALCFGYGSGTTFSWEGISHVGYFFLKALTYNMFAVLIAVLVKKTGFAIGVFFIYLFTENFLSQMLSILSAKMKLDKTADLGNLGDYLPLNAADGLLSFPRNTITDMSKGAMASDFTWVVLGFAIAYLVLFTWWSRHKYLKADL